MPKNPLGRKSPVPGAYNSDLLFVIPREDGASIKTSQGASSTPFFITTKKSFCESLPEEGPSEELLLLVRLDRHIGGRVSNASEDEALAHLVVIQEGTVRLVHGAALNDA